MKRRGALDPVQIAAIKRAHRCPHCDSAVRVDPKTLDIGVGHEETCPDFVAMRRAGSTGTVRTRRPGETVEAWLERLKDRQE